MKVLIIVPYFAPAWAYGGPPRVTFDFGRGLVERGHQVRVLTTDALERDRRTSLHRARLDGIDVDYLPNLSNRLAWDQKIFLPLGFPPAFLRWVGWADVVLLSDFRTFQNAVAAPVLRLLRKPFVLAAFGSLPLTPDWKNAPKRAFNLVAGNALLRDAGSLLAQSEQEAEQYGIHGATAPVDLLPLALDLRELEDLPERDAFRQAHGIGEHDPMVLFLGRLHEYKGLGVLADAFARVRPDVPGTHLVVVGRDDGYRTTLEARLRELGIGDAVTITGGLYGRDRLAAYVAADLFVLPATHQEETPLAGLEAMACGCPVVVSHQAAIPGLEAAGAGWEVDASPEAVAAAIAGALADEPRRREAGAAARRLVHERFTLDQRAAELEAILRRVQMNARPVPEYRRDAADDPLVAAPDRQSPERLGTQPDRPHLPFRARSRNLPFGARTSARSGRRSRHADDATDGSVRCSAGAPLAVTGERASVLVGPRGRAAGRSHASKTDTESPHGTTSPVLRRVDMEHEPRRPRSSPPPAGQRAEPGRYGQIYGDLPAGMLRVVLGPLPKPLLSIARRYLRAFGFPDVAGQVRYPAIVRLLEPWPGDRILDAGSGKGIYANSFGRRFGARAVGVELHPDRLREANAVASGLDSGAAFLEANLEQLAFANGAFDRAICVEVMEHVPDDDAAMAELWRVLRPGGLLVISVPAPDGPPSAPDEHDRTRPAWVYHVRDGYAPEELGALLDRHGFRLLRRQADWGPLFNRLVRLQCTLYQSSPFLLNVLASPLLMLARPLDNLFGRRRSTGHGWVYLAQREPRAGETGAAS